MYKIKNILIFLIFGIISFSSIIYSKTNNSDYYFIKNVLVATYSGPIVPISVEYINSSIEKLNRENFDLLVIRLDTPGGLDASMREIIKKMLDSKKPIIVYVYPKGGRAASAGVFITMASHIAAMSPSTNIGAATPVMIGGMDGELKKDKDKNKERSTIEEKVLNDAKAYIQSISQYKKRNSQWAIEAVTKSNSIPANEALNKKVVEFLAEDEKELLRKIDGFYLENFGVLKVSEPEFFYFEQTKRQKFLSTISDPNIAMLLMSIGVIGIFIELYNPGLILPGVVGSISLVLGLYSLQTLSANFAGILLILLGFVFLIAELKFMSYGLLTFAGVVSIFLGATMLFKNSPNVSGIGVDMGLLTINLLGLIIIIFIIGYFVVRSQFRKVETGKESMIGRKIKITSRLSPKGKIFFEGEWWDAQSVDGEIEENSEVEIIGMDGFVIKVKKVK